MRTRFSRFPAPLLPGSGLEAQLPSSFLAGNGKYTAGMLYCLRTGGRGRQARHRQSQGTSTSDQPELQPSPLILGLCDPFHQAGSRYHLAHFTAEQIEAQNPVCGFGHLAAHSACKRDFTEPWGTVLRTLRQGHSVALLWL